MSQISGVGGKSIFETYLIFSLVTQTIGYHHKKQGLLLNSKVMSHTEKKIMTYLHTHINWDINGSNLGSEPLTKYS